MEMLDLTQIFIFEIYSNKSPFKWWQWQFLSINAWFPGAECHLRQWVKMSITLHWLFYLLKYLLNLIFIHIMRQIMYLPMLLPNHTSFIMLISDTSGINVFHIF